MVGDTVIRRNVGVKFDGIGGVANWLRVFRSQVTTEQLEKPPRRWLRSIRVDPSDIAKEATCNEGHPEVGQEHHRERHDVPRRSRRKNEPR
jgi:hypothetical protein